MPRTRQQPDKGDDLSQYLQLYQLFGPEQATNTINNLDRVQGRMESDTAAQKAGYPNLESMNVGERVRQNDIVNQLRGEQAKDRTADTLLKGVNAASMLPNGQPLSQQLLQRYLQSLGIDSGGTVDAANPRQAALDKWKQKRKQPQSQP